MKNATRNCGLRTADWSYLPGELVTDIAARLVRPEERSRIRAVCPLWRSLVPSPNFNLTLPALPSTELTTCAVFLVQPLDFPWKRWILTVEQVNAGKFRVLHPLSRIHDQSLVNNSLDLRYCNVSLIVQSIFHHWLDDFVLKLQVHRHTQNYASTNSVVDGGGCTLVGITNQGRLYAFSLTASIARINRLILEDCDDIIVFKRKLCALSHNGCLRALFVNIEVENNILCNPIHETFTTTLRSRLVVSDGDLYLVTTVCSPPESVWFRIYKLLEAHRTWVEIRNLGGRKLFMSCDFCFFVSSRDLPGCALNCIVYQSNCFDRHDAKLFPEDNLSTKRFEIGFLQPKDYNLSRLMSYYKGMSQLLQSHLTWFSGDTYSVRRYPNKNKKVTLDHRRNSLAMNQDKTMASTSNLQNIYAAKFRELDLESQFIPTLEKIWTKYGNFAEGNAVQSRDIITTAHEFLAKVINILQKTYAKTLTEQQAEYLTFTLVDLQLMLD